MPDARAISAIANLQSEFSSTSRPDAAVGKGRGRPFAYNSCTNWKLVLVLSVFVATFCWLDVEPVPGPTGSMSREQYDNV
eukprot:609937-Rhodomonas_salina.1